jgi:hypothetical protein
MRVMVRLAIHQQAHNLIVNHLVMIIIDEGVPRDKNGQSLAT